MNSNKLSWIFAGLSIVMLILSIVLVLRLDKTEPEIRFEDINLTYSPDMDIHELYQGVTAYDDKDGDITEQIVIEKIVSSADGKSVSITYAVVDSSNNFTKKVRVFPQILKITEEVSLKEESAGSLNTVDNVNHEENPNSEENNNAAEEENSEDIDSEDNNTEADSTGVASVENEQEQRADSEEAEEIPVLKLSKNNITVKPGVRPAWVDVIETLTDDKDDYDTLYRNLVLGGEYEDNKIGVYDVTLVTVDSDGNKSAVCEIEIHVVE